MSEQLTEQEINTLRALLARLAPSDQPTGVRITGPLRIDNPSSDDAALFIHQQGEATAVHVVQETDNPCYKATAKGNAAGFEAEQLDEEDALWAPEADLRCRQAIAELHLCVGDGGSLQMAESGPGADPLEYHDALQLLGSHTLKLGSTSRPWRLALEAAEQIDFKIAGKTVLTIDKHGVIVRGGFATSAGCA